MDRRDNWVIVAAVLAMLIASCGDGEGQPVFTTAGDTTTSSEADPTTTTTDEGTTTSSSSSTTTAADSTTTTTTTAPGTTPVAEFVASAEISSPDLASAPLVGIPDEETASELHAEVSATGVDLTGVEFWILPVVGSDERLLVMEITEAALGLLEDPSGESVMTAIVDASSLEGAGITQFVVNYHGTDAEGEFVVTSTVAMDVLAAAAREGAEVGEDEMLVQLTRDGEVVEAP